MYESSYSRLDKLAEDIRGSATPYELVQSTGVFSKRKKEAMIEDAGSEMDQMLLDYMSSARSSKSKYKTVAAADTGVTTDSSGTSTPQVDYADPTEAPRNLSTPTGTGWEEFQRVVDTAEGAGNYDTLFSHAQKSGGKFDGTKVSEMTIGQLKEFANPSGGYGQFVKSLNKGVTATPMGRYQFVGRTLFATAKAMGLSDQTVFTPEVQDAMAAFKLNERLDRGTNLSSKRDQLRAEWAGFKHIPDSSLDYIISNTYKLRPKKRP
jgi:hypothetical protein